MKGNYNSMKNKDLTNKKVSVYELCKMMCITENKACTANYSVYYDLINEYISGKYQDKIQLKKYTTQDTLFNDSSDENAFIEYLSFNNKYKICTYDGCTEAVFCVKKVNKNYDVYLTLKCYNGYKYYGSRSGLRWSAEFKIDKSYLNIEYIRNNICYDFQEYLSNKYEEMLQAKKLKWMNKKFDEIIKTAKTK
jgi:hypothetical protein